MMTDETLTQPDEIEVVRPEGNAHEAASQTHLPEPEAPTTDLTTEASEASATPEPPKAEAPVQAKAEPKPELTDAQLFDQYLEAGEEDAGDGGAYKKLSRGDRVEAKVVQVEKDRVFVDLGTKSEGIVPLDELTDIDGSSAGDHVRVGDKISVVVIRPEGSESNAVVSKRRADFEDAWDRVEQAFRDGEFITAQVVERVKGGLVVDVGVRGFVPATHVGSGKLRNIEKYVGEPLKLKILEIDRDRKKVVLSNREAEEENRAKMRENIFNTVAPGDILEGSVRRLADYGAFIDLGGVDGLLHISEMSWARIQHPREMFKEGQQIKVMVLRLDKANGKISLGHRQVLPDPWNLIRENYTVGQKLTTTIGRIVVSGAFVRLPEGAEAFLPISEMSSRRIRRPEEAVEEGQSVEVQVIDLRPEERRMVLSIRALGGGAEAPRAGGEGGSFDDEDRSKRIGGRMKRGKKGGRRDEDEDLGEFIAGGRRAFPSGGATIGERLGMLKGLLRDEDGDEPEGEEAEASTAEATDDADEE